MGTELHGKTLGIVGCGRIGQTVAAYAHGLGIRTIGYDPVIDEKNLKSHGIEPVNFKTLCTESDIITFHTPLNNETRNTLNKNSIRDCKKGVMIVNCARGGIVDEQDLLDGLKSGQVGGAALDVFSVEPPTPQIKELINHPSVIATPHLGASTNEAQINVAREVASQICDIFENREFVGVVNVPYLSLSKNEDMKPFMQLSETIGRMISQYAGDHRLVSVKVSTWGGRDIEITTKPALMLLEAMFLKGVYAKEPIPVSMISASSKAKEKGLTTSTAVLQNKQKAVEHPYWNLVSAEGTLDNGEVISIAGSVFGRTPRIIQINDYQDRFTFSPEGGRVILSFLNEDRPGAILEVLAVLHEAGINVASFNNARKPGSAYALNMISIDDDEVSEKVLHSLESISCLKNIRKIIL